MGDSTELAERVRLLERKLEALETASSGTSRRDVLGAAGLVGLGGLASAGSSRAAAASSATQSADATGRIGAPDRPVDVYAADLEATVADLEQLAGDLDAGSHRLRNLAEPEDGRDAATRGYVDDRTGGEAGVGTVVTSMADLDQAIRNSPDTYEWSEHTQAGDAFVFPAGEYAPAAEDLPVTIDRPVWIRGCGRRQTVIRLPEGYDGDVFEIDYADYGHLTFSDFAVVGDGGTGQADRATDGQTVFRVPEGTYTWVFDRIHTWGVGEAIVTEGSQEEGFPGAWIGAITNCAFRRGNGGVHLQDNSHAVGVTNCSFDLNRDYHLRIRASTGVSVHQSQFEEWADYGIRIDWSDAFTIHGCYLESNEVAQIGLQPDLSRAGPEHRVTGSIRGCRIHPIPGAVGVQAGYPRKVTVENNGIAGNDGTAAFEWTTDFAESETRWEWNRIDNPVDTVDNY